eukprot:CAMPEP_0202958804 /NCGR_PEP_ID=MMETSP1396-20130829/3068_1 /ASSEMBLY_ACC=CAM_ASM_000872 /TAXON_ID= /ORGANISM="Pseudokeronopsis sp., Strain Brazil" /LENGTH=71 /DNA_ID=CAMNT_0049677053 /DNA_START=1311 /DNA_END=1526 /DNA_ORIENTATION=-
MNLMEKNKKPDGKGLKKAGTLKQENGSRNDAALQALRDRHSKNSIGNANGSNNVGSSGGGGTVKKNEDEKE